MKLDDLLNLNPFVMHGTDVRNTKSILDKGLFSHQQLKDRGINFHAESRAEMQKLNNSLEMVSVWIIDNDKYGFERERGGGYRVGPFRDTTERVKEIMSKIGAYDYYFVFNTEQNPPIKPAIYHFPYEGFVKGPIKVDEENVEAIIFIENFHERWDDEKKDYAKGLSIKIGGLIKKLGIPLVVENADFGD